MKSILFKKEMYDAIVGGRKNPNPVRKEILNAITEEDAVQEGVSVYNGRYWDYQINVNNAGTARHSFLSLWASIHGNWATICGQEVWVYEFMKIDGIAADISSYPQGDPELCQSPMKDGDCRNCQTCADDNLY